MVGWDERKERDGVRSKEVASARKARRGRGR